jgi:hypothetical protein
VGHESTDHESTKGDESTKKISLIGRPFRVFNRFRVFVPSVFVPSALYLAAAVAITWPLAIHLTDRIGALQGPGDPFLNLWILGWGLRAWTTNPGSVLNGQVFDANIFHPAENTLAYSDHFLLQSLALSPVYAITGDAVLCYNLLLIVSIALSGLAMHALVRAVTGSMPAAFLGGLAWACWPYRTAHLLHIQLQALYFMPLALLCLHRLVAGRRWRDAWALGALTALQAIASVYYGVMTAIVLAVSGIVLAVSTGQWRSRRLIARAVVAAVIAVVLAAPVLLPYVRSQDTEGFGRTMFEASNHSAALQSYLQVPPTNLVYGTTGVLAPRVPRAGARDRSGVEHHLFPGFVLVALAAFGVARHWRSDRKPLVRSSLALVIAGIVLSLGPEGFRDFYAALHDNVFGFQAIRAPARFAVIAMAGLAVLAGLGVRNLTAAPILIAALLVEYLNAPLPLAAAPPRETQVGAWLENAPEPGAVIYLPLTIDIDNTPFMVQSLEHGRPIVNGYSGQRPAFYSAVVDALADMPSAEALSTLKELDVRFVVSESALAGAGSPKSPLVERARLAEGNVYELRWTPEAEAALDDVNVPPPPPPGTPSFAAGETATYDVHWDSGPLEVPAGRATIRVIDGEPGSERWEFEATAETAAWVSSFFQARDRFTTRTDGLLEPTEHVREIREGRRHVDRAYVFDRASGVVRVGDSPADARRIDSLALPLAADGTRDSVSALFYVRTLPLEPGSIVTVPINEGGNNLILQVAVAEEETIDVGGASHRALRLEPRLMRRIERRTPLNMTIWLSADDRRVPLRAVIEAGFGRVRLDLVDYRR